MRTLPSSFQMLTASAVIAMIAGCSSSDNSAIVPKPASQQAGVGHRFVSHYTCPATGPLKYVSDALDSHSVINVYAGKFAGQAPCGQITSGLSSPAGLFVQAGTHDLYVANLFNSGIQVFHRGQTTPYNTYTNPHPPGVPVDVTVAKDGTVIASSSNNTNHHFGFISTWVGGPNGGTFVGNFPMPRNEIGEFVTVQRNGTVYFDTINAVFGPGKLWSVSCPRGACGAQTRVAGVRLDNPEGMAFDAERDLIVATLGSADTFELPNPNPSSFPLPSRTTPMGLAVNRLDHHLFVVDYRNNLAAEYSYPEGTLIGTVPGNPDGVDFGIAVDP